MLIMRRYWIDAGQDDYVRSFRRFLVAAKGHPFISFLTLYSFLGPIVAAGLCMAGGEIARGTAIGAAGIVFLVGVFVVTMKLNFPIYNEVTTWDAAARPDNWKQIRERFNTLNLIRGASALFSFVMLIVAL